MPARYFVGLFPCPWFTIANLKIENRGTPVPTSDQ